MAMDFNKSPTSPKKKGRKNIQLPAIVVDNPSKSMKLGDMDGSKKVENLKDIEELEIMEQSEV